MEDYEKQLQHLKKELEALTADYEGVGEESRRKLKVPMTRRAGLLGLPWA